MQSYRNYPGASAVQRSPNSQRRTGPPNQAGHNVASAQMQAPNPRQVEMQAQAEQARREQAKRQSKRPTDKNLPDGLAEVIIGDGVERYVKLRDVERRLDAVMMRKRMDIADSVSRTFRQWRTMRLWISNTADNQPWQQSGIEPETFDFGSDSQANFRVKIEGRLLDEEDDAALGDGDGDMPAADIADAMDTDGPAARAKRARAPHVPAASRSRLSHFFKQITIDFDRAGSLQPDGFTQIEWKKPESRGSAPNTSEQANFDTLEFERKSDENINVTIKLYRDDLPERFRLKPELARLLDTEEDDRAGAVMGIWNYILENKLQQDDDARTIRLDDNLKRLFGQSNEVLHFARIPDLVLNFLLPLDPITLKYTIRVDKAYIEPAAADSGEAALPSAPTVYDILVPSAIPFRSALASMTHFAAINANPSADAATTLGRLLNLDDTLALVVQAISQSKAKQAYYTSLSKDPVKFINRWVASQRRDLQVILGESQGGVNGVGSVGMGWDEVGREEWRWGGDRGVWGTKGAVEAAGLYLGKMRPAAQI